MFKIIMFEATSRLAHRDGQTAQPFVVNLPLACELPDDLPQCGISSVSLKLSAG
jgi:hypothetical protein